MGDLLPDPARRPPRPSLHQYLNGATTPGFETTPPLRWGAPCDRLGRSL